MGNKGRSDPNLFGGYTHYDSKGNKTGRTEPGLFGGYNHYDAKGNKIGHSDPSLFGGYTHYDSHGNKTGHTDPGLFGSYEHYDAKGKRNGSSDPGLFGSYSNNDADGCYIATCIYGSYDTPEVWVLRRFRDSYLASRMWGRGFIKLYYRISPLLVSKYGKHHWFHLFWHWSLNTLVDFLESKGYQTTPYKDIDWRHNHD